jgi:hypothetical protein
MKFAAILHAALLGSVTGLAVPSYTPDDPRPTIRGSRLIDRLQTLSADRPQVTPTAAPYSSVWAGAVLTGAGYRTVVGSIQVPPIRLPPNASSDELHGVSAWVGIDGQDACPNAILQVGVDMFLNHSVTQYWAW